jgi:hypothetical protein
MWRLSVLRPASQDHVALGIQSSLSSTQFFTAELNLGGSLHGLTGPRSGWRNTCPRRWPVRPAAGQGRRQSLLELTRLA